MNINGCGKGTQRVGWAQQKSPLWAAWTPDGNGNKIEKKI